MVWAELDGSDWTLPASRNKTKADLLRPLTATAIAALPEKTGSHVFSNDGKTQISAYSKFKKRFDEAVLRELKNQDPEAEALPNWTLHDLRRTARSLMSRANVNVDHAERCLGHVIGGVRGVYDRHGYHAEMAAAYERLALKIEQIVNPPDGANVVAFKPVAENV